MSERGRRPRLRLTLAPAGASGWVTVVIAVLAILLLAGRIVLVPALHLPLNFLVVFVAFGAAGITGAYAIAVDRERSVVVALAALAGLLALFFLAAEAVSPP